MEEIIHPFVPPVRRGMSAILWDTSLSEKWHIYGTVLSVHTVYHEQEFTSVSQFGVSGQMHIPVSGPTGWSIEIELGDGGAVASDIHMDLDPVVELWEGIFFINLRVQSVTIDEMITGEIVKQKVVLLSEHCASYSSREEAAAKYMEELLSEKE